jgi:hypothetical protein
LEIVSKEYQFIAAVGEPLNISPRRIFRNPFFATFESRSMSSKSRPSAKVVPIVSTSGQYHWCKSYALAEYECFAIEMVDAAENTREIWVNTYM